MDREVKPRRDKADEAMKIMADISIPLEEAAKRVHSLTRRMKPANQMFVVSMGLWFRNEASQREGAR